MAHEIVFAPEALSDLRELYDYVAIRSGTGRASGFTDRIITHCVGLATFPERGTRRDDLRPGLRITTWRRRVTIAFHITPELVVIDRILYGGRELKLQFDNQAEC